MTAEPEDGRLYRGLLLDWGGVLTTSPFASFGAFCDQVGLPWDTFVQRLRTDDQCRALVVGLETGRLDQEDFERQFAARLGVSPAALINRLFAGSVPDERMFTAVAKVRQGGVRTGLLSNSWGTRRYPRDRLAALFDAVVISGEVGVRKPSPEIYRLAAQRIDLEPSGCVFVDDLAVNLEPAAELGMVTVHHVQAEQTIAELERLLQVSLR